MSIDMEQFKATYIEESLEGLDSMETCLLELEVGSKDQDAINTIFRSAHSIKGGGATFGFSEISEFTHVVETLLDEIRNGDREVTQEAIDLFLASVDCIRDMLSSTKDGVELEDEQKIKQVQQALQNMLQSPGEDSQAADEPDTSASTQDANVKGWNIEFKPYPELLKTGNDVVRMLRELDELGQMSVEVDTEKLPALVDLDPEECHLSWKITLKEDIDKSQVEDVFVWVEDECDLDISPVAELTPGSDNNEPRFSADTTEKSNNVTEAGSLADIQQQGDRRSGDDRRRKTASSESSSIRVDIDKIDALINMVGELVITQSMLSQLGSDFDVSRLEKLQDGLVQLERNTRELQENVMQIRMIPISFAFNRFPRMIHDMCNKFGKKAQLKLSGESTELDKTVMEKIGDPLVHLVRNSMDHGIEMPDKRLEAGKPETGTVHLNAYHQGGNIVIEVSDDGAGLNKDKILMKAVERGLVDRDADLTDSQIFDLIFNPGFSTADQVTDVSGRGVGMDVVKKNIQALSGNIEVRSEDGKGSTFSIRLPLTLAILDGQLIKVADQIYIVPLVSIIESLQIYSTNVNAIAGKAELYKLRDEYIPIIHLGETFGLDQHRKGLKDGLLVVVEGDNRKVALLVDDLLAQQQVVIKSLESNYKKVEGLSGATILGDGTVALIIDVAGIIRVSQSGPGGGKLHVVSDNSHEAA